MRNQDSTVIPIRLSYGALVLVALAAGGCTLPDDCPNGWCAFEEEQWFDALEDLWVDPASCDAWAAGGPSTTNGANGAWHFDGTAWSQVATAEPWRLHGVVALAPDDAVVFGDYTVQRWNGAALVTEAIAPDDVQWRAGAASAPDDLWIVGYAGRVGHWDGAAWSVTRLGDGSEDLLAVQAVSASEVWVGSQAGSLWRWDGEAWTRIELKDPHRRFSRIDTLTGDAQRGLWAFGSTQWRLGTFGWETPLVRSASRVNAAAIVGDEVWAVGENGLILRHSR